MNNNPSLATIITNPQMFLAFGFGSGLSPVAPGTMGTLVAALLWVFLAELPLISYLVFISLSGIFGVYLCGSAAKKLGVHDHAGIVWDEFVGLWIAMIALPFEWQYLVLGFVLFRFFDIVKPWPISWIDGNVGGGFGIMIDDAVAGVATGVTIQLLIVFDLV
ncbi:MAG: phosphatidylglycerophosphatase A [Porticoccaceae bacterium]|nr:phosphatidylglycerophosphatase A [Porticoccaceae bacterium]MDG1474013.1 phosphatidylglycerophosphatase A [Porticoccaceae bacterium]